MLDVANSRVELNEEYNEEIENLGEKRDGNKLKIYIMM